MATSEMSEVIQHLRRTVLLRDGAGLTDGQLLEDYLSRRDEAALAVLVQRHGPMVWGVCRRVLRSHHDAEDAFQATFLVLVRKAASIVPRQMVANWLYGVAHQTALNARATAAKRKGRERQVTEMPEPAVAEQDLWADLQPLLDAELSRLPDKYRAVVILCDLEGKTRKEAARQLGVPEGTVAGRLARAREMLAKRLAQRGVALPGGALAMLLAQQAAAGVPRLVVVSTINAVTLVAAGKTAATGLVSAKVAALTEGVVKAMFMTKIKSVLAVVLVLSFVTTGATILTCRTAAGQQDKRPAAEKPATREAKDKPKALKDEEAIQGTWQVVALEDKGEKEKAKAIKATNIRLAFTGNKLVMSGPTPDLLDVSHRANTFVLNEKTSPKQIDITSVGWTEIGIYAFEKGQLKICLDRTGKNRPTSFTTEKGSDQYCMTLKKQEKDKADPPAQKKDDKEMLQGIWKGEAVEMAGILCGKEDGLNWKFEMLVKGDELTLRGPYLGKGVSTVPDVEDNLFRFKVRKPKSQKEIDLARLSDPNEDTPKGSIGIYALDGNTLRMCLDLANEKRPAELKTSAKTFQLLLVLKRADGAKWGDRPKAEGQEGKEAEKLFRTFEKKLAAAKAIRIVLDGTGSGIEDVRGGVKYKGRMVITEGNKARFEMEEEVGGIKQKSRIVSDGTKMVNQLLEGDDPPRDTPKKFFEETIGYFKHGGAAAGHFHSGDAEAAESVATFKASAFKLGKKEKIGKREAQVIEYKLTWENATEDDAKLSLAEKLWLDVETNLPLKRVFTGKLKEEFTFTENYSEFTLDPQLDAKLFELPK